MDTWIIRQGKYRLNDCGTAWVLMVQGHDPGYRCLVLTGMRGQTLIENKSVVSREPTGRTNASVEPGSAEGSNVLLVFEK
jgi:hypothetical protein